MLLKLSLLTLSVLTLGACSAGHNKTNVEWIQGMMDQPSMKAQEWDEVRDEPGMRVPPEGTVARGKPPYKYQFDPEAAGKNLKSPFVPTDELLALGKEKYDIYCALCHGITGAGEGQIAEHMALKPPSLLTDKVVNHPDGRLYHIITAGQGVMGAYAPQIQDSKHRWAIVKYIRSLQGGQ